MESYCQGCGDSGENSENPKKGIFREQNSFSDESQGIYLDFEGQMEFANVALGLGILGGGHRVSIEAGE